MEIRVIRGQIKEGEAGGERKLTVDGCQLTVNKSGQVTIAFYSF